MGIEDIRGVNLGGWLVLERWISPSVFEGTDAADEYSLCQALSVEQARSRLKQHRDSFITEPHIKQIAEMGLNTVRVPVGYWLFEDQEMFIGGGAEYVSQLFSWVKKYNLKVILDFHAAPGSQNGWDHSGRAGTIDWLTEANVNKSLDFLNELASRFGKEKMLLGIELLNEPHWNVPLNLLVKYYQNANSVIKANCHDSVRTIVSDAFRAKDISKALLRAQLTDVVLDTHLYQLFTPEDRALDLKGHINKVNNQWVEELSKLRHNHDILVGEWSSAMSELYDGSSPQKKYTTADYESYCAEQLKAFNECEVGWTYWTARTEDGGIWSLLDHPEMLKTID